MGVAASAAVLYTPPAALAPQWPRGGVVTQRSAKPFTPVQFRTWPPLFSYICERFAQDISPLPQGVALL